MHFFNIVRHHIILILNTNRPISSNVFLDEVLQKSWKVWVWSVIILKPFQLKSMFTLQTWTLIVSHWRNITRDIMKGQVPKRDSEGNLKLAPLLVMGMPNSCQKVSTTIIIVVVVIIITRESCTWIIVQTLSIWNFGMWLNCDSWLKCAICCKFPKNTLIWITHVNCSLRRRTGSRSHRCHMNIDVLFFFLFFNRDEKIYDCYMYNSSLIFLSIIFTVGW